MLTPQAVLLQEPGEDELAAMSRVAAMPAAQLQAVRAELCRLRGAENARAEALLLAWLVKAGLELDSESAACRDRCLSCS